MGTEWGTHSFRAGWVFVSHVWPKEALVLLQWLSSFSPTNITVLSIYGQNLSSNVWCYFLVVLLALCCSTLTTAAMSRYGSQPKITLLLAQGRNCDVLWFKELVWAQLCYALRAFVTEHVEKTIWGEEGWAKSQVVSFIYKVSIHNRSYLMTISNNSHISSDKRLLDCFCNWKVTL